MKGLTTNQGLRDLRFDKLPDIPKIWIDFLNSALSVLPAPSVKHTFAEKAEAVRSQSIQRIDLARVFIGGNDQRSPKARENLRLLRQPESLAVVANLHTGLFGGSAFQILKCLSAIKVCDELGKHAITAVPVGWIDTVPSVASSPFSLNLLDSDSELHTLQFPQPNTDGPFPTDPLPPGPIAVSLNQVEKIGQGNFDPEIIELLKASFHPGTTMARATGQLLSTLMEEWGMLVVDPSAPELLSDISKIDHGAPVLESAHRAFLIQCSMLPVIASIIDPEEVESCISAQRHLDGNGLEQPLAWPRASATIMDSRSSRTLERYHLQLRQLYAGEQRIVDDLRNTMPRTALEKLDSLRAEAETRIAGLKTLNSAGKEFGKTVDSNRGKILFQIDKLAEHFEAACKRRSETAERQIHKACNFLAPNGKLQERELAGIQLPLRYSRSILRSLYEKLDILDSDHQIIFME
jgi:uncharacterized protein YllA (UPF0747 family)